MSHYFFRFDPFSKLGQKYKNIFVCFLVQMETLKFAFEINWSLATTVTATLKWISCQRVVADKLVHLQKIRSLENCTFGVDAFFIFFYCKCAQIDIGLFFSEAENVFNINCNATYLSNLLLSSVKALKYLNIKGKKKYDGQYV